MLNFIRLFCFLFATILSFSAYAAPEKYIIDPNHATLCWHASHFGFSSPSGKFANLTGTLILDEQEPKKSKIEVQIDTKALLTGNSKFDEHLKSPDFLNVTKFPVAKFISNDITILEKKQAVVFGDLTLLGVTKKVALNVKLNKIGVNPLSQQKTAGFSVEATIKRSDFGIKYGLPGISDQVKINIELEANLAKEQ